MTLGGIAGLIAAVAFVLLVGALAVPLIKLGRVFDQAGTMLREVTDETTPLLRETTTTVATTNAQLQRVDAITANVQEATANVSALTATLATTFGSPVIRVAAFGYGVRRAVAGTRAERRERRERRALRGGGAARRRAEVAVRR